MDINQTTLDNLAQALPTVYQDPEVGNKQALDRYLEDRGIDVQWNTLGLTPELRRLFIEDTQHIVDASDTRESHHVKHACYSLFQEMEVRPKLTGFEAFADRDLELRSELSSIVTESQFTPTEILERTPGVRANPETRGYYDTLVAALTDLNDKPKLVYFSGGLDSELMLRAILDSIAKYPVDNNLPVTVVTLVWMDDKGIVQNYEDVEFARIFCRVHNIQFYTQAFNITKLWASPEFKDFMVATQLTSPQLATYAWAAKELDTVHPGHRHLFAGEVRYRSNFVQDDQTEANIVYLTKLSPAYNGQTYTATYGIGAYSGLVYDQAGKWWKIVTDNTPWTTVFPANPFAGTAQFSNNNTVTHEMRTSASVAVNTGSGGGYIFQPNPAPTWHTLANNSFVADIAAGIGSYNHVGTGVVSLDVTFTIELRTVGNPAVMSSTCRFVVYDGDGSTPGWSFA